MHQEINTTGKIVKEEKSTSRNENQLPIRTAFKLEVSKNFLSNGAIFQS